MAEAARQEFQGLVRSLAINGDNLLRSEAARVATLAVRAQESARNWAEAVEQRRIGRGRRPSRQIVERARRAAHLDDRSYCKALDRLRLLVSKGQPSPLADAAEKKQA
jgi:hypothetical protein